MNKKITISVILAFLLGIIACDSNDSKQIVNEGYLTGTDNAEIYYRIMGTGQDTVVVVHGGPGAGMNTVIPSFKPLAEQFVLIFYDQRGGGRSTLPADTTKLKPQYFVEDLEAVRTHFGLGQMNVTTHSFGSVLVAQYAKNYPHHLKRMVFHGATGPNLQQELKIRTEKAKVSPPSPDTVLSNHASELLQKLLNGTASDPVATCHKYEAINKKLALARGDTVTYRGTTCEAPPEAVRYYYRYTAQLAPRYYGGWNFTRGLEKVMAQLLVVHGKQDSLMIPAQRAWANAVPNGHLLLVPRADKGALSDNPEFILPVIKTFFGGSMKKLERAKLEVSPSNQSNETNFSCMENENQRQFDFWIGKWDVFVDGQKAAESHIERTLGGCMILENYQNLKSGYAGKSMNFYDPKRDEWIQIWTDNQGNVSRYNGKLRDGKMYFRGTNNRRDGTQTKVRMEFIPKPDGTVRQIYEQSTDAGKSWETLFDGTYRPRQE